MDLTGVASVEVEAVKVEIMMPENVQERNMTDMQTSAMDAETSSPSDLTGNSHDNDGDDETLTNLKHDYAVDGDSAGSDEENPVYTHNVLNSIDNSPYYSRPAEITLLPSYITIFLPAPPTN